MTERRSKGEKPPVLGQTGQSETRRKRGAGGAPGLHPDPPPSTERGQRLRTPERRPSAREVALRLLTRIEQEAAYANLALGDWLNRSGVTGPDRGLATELVYGGLRHRLTLDWVIDQFSTTPTAKMTPWIRNILRQGVYQLLFLDRIPVNAAVSESVELAKRFGHPGTVRLVNAVLRGISRSKGTINYPDVKQEPVRHISVRYSHPEWMVQRWLGQFGLEGTIALCQTNNRAPDLFLRCNTLKVKPEELMPVLSEQGVKTEPAQLAPEGLKVVEGRLAVEELPSFGGGLFTVQGESSMLVGYAVKPRPGSTAVDCCSAPGGKTTHLAQLMQNHGRVYAFDIHPHRLGLVKDACRRLGIDIVETFMADARELPEWLDGKADAVLVDAPCSGLGVLRGRPDARWRKEPADLEQLPSLQLAILDRAAGCVCPGGVLVYSTCSIAPEENNGVIERFLKGHPEFTADNLLPFLPFSPERPEDRHTAAEGWIQLLPHIHGTDGFFICRLKKAAT